jgi:hypothetical protein
MATQKQRQVARKNVKQAQAGARRKRTIAALPKKTRTALGREGAKAAARKRGATKGTGTGAGAMTVTELRRRGRAARDRGALEDGQGVADPCRRAEAALIFNLSDPSVFTFFADAVLIRPFIAELAHAETAPL